MSEKMLIFPFQKKYNQHFYIYSFKRLSGEEGEDVKKLVRKLQKQQYVGEME